MSGWFSNLGRGEHCCPDCGADVCCGCAPAVPLTAVVSGITLCPEVAPYLPDPNGTYHLEVALDPGGGIRSWQGSTGTWTLSLSCLGGNYELVIDLSGDVVAFMALGHRGLSTPFIGDAPTEASCGDGSGFGGVRIAYGGTVTVTVTEETEE